MGITGAVSGDSCRLVEEKRVIYIESFGEDKFLVMANQNFVDDVLGFFSNIFTDFSFRSSGDPLLGKIYIEELPKLYDKTELGEELFIKLQIDSEEFVKEFRYYYETSKVSPGFLEKVMYARNNNLDNGYYSDHCSCGSTEDCTHLAYLIEKISEDNNLDDPSLVLSLGLKESSCKIEARDSLGARGFLQIMQDPFGDSCSHYLDSLDDVTGEENLANNLDCGIKILKNKYFAFEEGVLNSLTYNQYPSFAEKVDVCIEQYPQYGTYLGWRASFRGYNGWACGESTDIHYADKVAGYYDALVNV